MAVIECVPNVSEGRRQDVIDRIADALRAVPGLRVLDVQSDATHNRSVFTLAGDAAAMSAGIPGAVRTRARRHRSAHAQGRTSAHGRRGRGAVHPDRRRDDGGVRAAGEVDRRRRRRAFRRADLPLRRRVVESSAQEPRRHPARRVRRARGEAGAAGMGAGLRPGGAARQRRRVGDRRAHAADRLQHQPRDRSARCRQEDRGGDPDEQRRLALREGDGHPARGSRHRPGVDEPHQLREDADLPGLRDGQARGRALRREACSRARSSAWCRRRRCTQSVEFYLQLEGFCGAQVLENKLRSHPEA